MKNLLLIFAFILGSVSFANAQDFSIGPTAGANYSRISDAPGDTHGLVGFNAGVTMVYSYVVHWGIGLDIKYSGEGVMTEQGGEVAKTRLNYIRVPLKIYGFFNDLGDDFRPKIYIGPSFGFLAGGKVESFLGSSVDAKNLYETYDLGLIAGAGFNYRIAEITWFNFDVAYYHGIMDIAKTGNGSNRNLNVNVGIAWGF